jgi:archaemetzincin
MRYFTILFLFFLFACKGSNPKKEIIAQKDLLDSLKKLDVLLGQPQPGDWLYNNQEKGQTFDQYKTFAPLPTDPKRSFFYIQPIGDFDIYQLDIVRKVSEYLGLFYSLPIRCLEPIPDKIFPGDIIRFTSTGNHQVLTHYILDSILTPHLPDSAIMLMAITNRDLYTGPNNNFLFGQATFRKRVAVSSMQRFLDDTTQCLQRIMKTASHETGHMLGMKHCIYAHCLMNGSNSSEELNNRPFHLCSQCTKKICWNLHFPLQTRYQLLKEYYLFLGLNSEARYIENSQKALGMKD